LAWIVAVVATVYKNRGERTSRGSHPHCSREAKGPESRAQLTFEKTKFKGSLQNGEMQGSGKIQEAQSCADTRSGFFR
jgi:hypothetical protein